MLKWPLVCILQLCGMGAAIFRLPFLVLRYVPYVGLFFEVVDCILEDWCAACLAKRDNLLKG